MIMLIYLWLYYFILFVYFLDIFICHLRCSRYVIYDFIDNFPFSY